MICAIVSARATASTITESVAPVLVSPRTKLSRKISVPNTSLGVIRPAAGHQLDDRKRLQRADDAEQEERLRHRRQHRHDHGKRQLVAPGAVDPRRIEHFRRQVGDAGNVHQHREAGPLPDIDDDEPVDRERRAAKHRIGERDADRLQYACAMP